MRRSMAAVLLMLVLAVPVSGRSYQASLRDGDEAAIVSLLDRDAPENLTLLGQLPEPEVLSRLEAQYPDTRFCGNPILGGTPTNLQSQRLDLTGSAVTAEELDRWIPCYPNLNWVELGDTALDSDALDALNHKYPQVVIAWNVELGPVRCSTGVRAFMPFLYGYPKLSTADLTNLKYCIQLEMIDLGHCEVTNVDFVTRMPKLRYLLLCESRVRDIRPIAKCKNLEVLELFLSDVSDYAPLLNLTKLRDLNLSFDPCAGGVYRWPEDLSPLLQMTWLDRLWMPLGFNLEMRAQFSNALPETAVHFPVTGSTKGGWRASPGYFAQRDYTGLIYMYT